MMSFVASIIRDFKAAAGNHVVWYNFAVFDVASKYRKTIIGPLWNSLTCLLIILVLTAVWSVVFKQSYAIFLPKMAIGYTVWWYINSVVSGACTVFTGNNRAIIQNANISLISICLRHVLACFIFFAHNFLAVLILLGIAGFEAAWTNLSFLIGILLITFIAIPVTILIGLLSARFSDIQVLITNIMGIGIMISPVMWDIELLGEAWRYAYINPFTPFLEICKNSARGQWPGLLDIQVIAGMSCFFWVLAAIAHHKYKKELIYWL